MKTNKGMTKISIVFNGKDAWSLGLERDLAERSTTEATQKHCLVMHNKILIPVGSPVCRTAQTHSSEIIMGSVQSNVMDC